MLQAILFDVGQVLLKLKTEDLLNRVEKACPSLERRSLLSELRESGSHHHAYEMGEITGPEFHAHLVERYRLPWSYAEWLGHWNDYFTVNRPMELLVAKLKGRVKFYALSNTNPEHYLHFKNNYRLFEAFEQVIGSHQHGLRKPDPRLYLKALEIMRLPADSVLFIDDVLKQVEAARAVGMHGFHYTFNDLELKAYLRKLGVDVPVWEELPSPYQC